MEYPKYFKECPLCHCTERVMEQEVNQAKKDGLISEERMAASQIRFHPVMDPLKIPFAFDVLHVFFDYCAKCGHEYPHTIIKIRMTQDQFQAMMGQMMGLPSKNPGGRR